MRKFVRFKDQGNTLYGEVRGEKIWGLQGTPFEDNKKYIGEYSLNKVRLQVPVVPGKIIGMGLNYKSVAQMKGLEVPVEPTMFLKPSTSLITDGDEIRIPEMVIKPFYEVELAVVIGMYGKNIPLEQADKHIFGYMVSNDVTAKDHMVTGQPWTKGKCFDTFTPVSPFIVTGIDPDDIGIQSYLNGEKKQDGNTSDLIFNVRELVAYISRFMTLEPGDLILTGAPMGAGDLKIGDVIECRSPILGRVINRVVKDSDKNRQEEGNV